jgi:bile acid:Na+ symporter, BASS family
MSVEQVLTALFNAGVVASIVATVLSLGMSLTIARVIAPLRRIWLVVGIIILNAVIIPATAWGVAWLFPISDASVSGLTLATLGAGSAAGLKATQLAKHADLPLAVALVVVLQLVNIVTVPLWAGLVVIGGTISAGEIVKNLLALVLIPLLLGLFIRARSADGATRWPPVLVRIANLALLIALASGLAVNWRIITTLLGSWVLVAALAIVLIALGLGLLLGWRDSATRTTTGLLSGMRFGSLGLIIIGTQLGGNPVYLGPAICFALIDLLIPLAVAVELGRRAGTATRASRSA